MYLVLFRSQVVRLMLRPLKELCDQILVTLNNMIVGHLRLSFLALSILLSHFDQLKFLEEFLFFLLSF